MRELLTTADQLVMRSETPATALDMGLEHARGSMVRNNPAEALAMLDEVWSGAQHTETGWYLRASSLALLGLTGEALRVAKDAVVRNPNSSANHFLLSLAKLSVGELQAARASIADASRNREPDALLLVQSALLEAQSGNTAEAEQLFRRAALQSPEHAALQYGRRMIREILQSLGRDRTFASGVPSDAAPRWSTPAFARTPVSVNSLPVEDIVPDAAMHGDAIADAMQQLGAKLRTDAPHEVAVTARTILASLASGGALANTTSPARALVMRTMVTAVLSALNPSRKAVGWTAVEHDGQWQRAAAQGAEPREGETQGRVNAGRVTADFASDFETDNEHEVLIDAVRLVVTALRAGRPGEAQQHVQRANGLLDNMSLSLLRILVASTGESKSDEAVARSTKASARETDDIDKRIRTHDAEPQLLAPIRLGLALLPVTDLLNHALRPLAADDIALRNAGQQGAGIYSGEPDEGQGPAANFGALVAAAGVLALAVLAFAFRQSLLGIALLGAGGWLVMRSQHTP